MIKILNNFLCILKVLLLMLSFVFTFYIVINMYRRLEKPFIESIYNFIPFILLFIIFSINLVLRQKNVNKNLFYNITCCLVFVMILFACFRALTDQNMVVIMRLGYDINFNYFADIIAPMKAMLYMLSLSNILLMVDGIDFDKLLKKEEEPLPKKKKKIELKPAK